MTTSKSEKTIPGPVTRETPSGMLRSARKTYVPGVREPFRLPEEKITLPCPNPLPGAPPAFNWFTSLLPPILIIAGMLVMMQFMPNTNRMFIFPTMIMSLGFPLANIINLVVQRKSYKSALEKRKTEYKALLEGERIRLSKLAQDQRNIMEEEYPDLKPLLGMAASKGFRPRLWWRRPEDSDYLSLRVGKGEGKPSFEVLPPNFMDRNDPLISFPLPIIDEFSKVQNLPFLLDLKKVGSVGITGMESKYVYALAYRLILEIITHHSPKEVRILCISDQEDWSSRWDWLKWVPHTRALSPDNKIRSIAYRQGSITEALDWITEQYKQRREQQNRISKDMDTVSIVAIFDDRGKIRQMPEIFNFVERGFDAGIFCIFIGDRNLPRVRAKLEALEATCFRYVETWEGGKVFRGETSLPGRPEVEIAARSMAQLELLGDKSSYALPENMRLSQLIEADLSSTDAIKNNWGLPRSDRELLQFPIGVQVSRDGLEPLLINLLPMDRGGSDAYHSILIGTTGSGKSEFMKSLVLGAAYKYGPRLLNFFFMDFKGGAAFNIFSDIPHVAGIVTNLTPDLVERGLDALQSEIAHRQQLFSQVSVQNIWEYNRSRSSQPLPHVLLLLDEFAKGLAEFDRLKPILELLVRQGRSLGIYLILANQDVNSAVDTLLSNTGWRIALKVARQEEMHIIDKNLPPAKRAGQGYLRSLNGDIYEFQAGYSGFSVQTPSLAEVDDFKIYQVEPDGVLKVLYQHNRTSGLNDATKLVEKEEERLISLMKQVSRDLNVETARPIYLPPLSTEIALEDTFTEVGNDVYRTFSNGHWSDVISSIHYLNIPAGFLDFPRDCLQKPLQIDFTEQDGHLWVVGSPGSGKVATLSSLLLSLTLTHTPDEVNLYILDFGSGELQQFITLPHVGAVIRTQEQERFERLLSFLDQIIARRTTINYDDSGGDGHSEKKDEESDEHLAAEKMAQPIGQKQIFLVINNFAELRTTYQDFVERISRYVRDGKAAGIHLIISTNRGTELPRSISSNIARRIVLHMAAREEYLDITQKNVPSLATRAIGRGYWVSGEVVECQISLPLNPDGKDKTGEIINKMKQNWRGAAPTSISNIRKKVRISEAITRLPLAENGLKIPIGIAYDTLEIVTVDLQSELPFWLVLGARQSGKSNFLATVAHSITKIHGEDWDVSIFTLRRSPLISLNGPVKVCSASEQIVSEAQTLVQQLDQNLDRGKKLLLLIDDLGAAFDPSCKPMLTALDTLASKVRERANNDVCIMASALPDEFRMGMSSPIHRILRQHNTGLGFTTDPMILEMLGIMPAALTPYRKMDLPPGRGFYMNKKAQFVQTFLADER